MASTDQTFIVRPLGGQDQENQVYDDVPIDATVRDLKLRIFVAQGIPVEKQKLLYGPEVMDDSRTLESYHIRKGFIIRLVRVIGSTSTPTTTQPPLYNNANTDAIILKTIFVNPAKGRQVTMNEVPLVTTVEEFRKLYSSRQKQDPDVCRLIFAGKELEDVKLGKVMTLKDYAVQNESTLHEVYRLRGGSGK
ncbi:hypothetical protein GJ744_002743 [Endocarpon pusillum]|uniref:Ubiquitin-like domain-containing protein n=1 Tax=Endocarpon pusillum TaxID=364733 RepID=A0A8H7AVS1_9EURO|nr:hypothetical protein GJ744_002743 [Endocarpon pusillum]